MPGEAFRAMFRVPVTPRFKLRMAALAPAIDFAVEGGQRVDPLILRHACEQLHNDLPRLLEFAVPPLADVGPLAGRRPRDECRSFLKSGPGQHRIQFFSRGKETRNAGLNRPLATPSQRRIFLPENRFALRGQNSAAKSKWGAGASFRRLIFP